MPPPLDWGEDFLHQKSFLLLGKEISDHIKCSHCMQMYDQFFSGWQGKIGFERGVPTYALRRTEGIF